MSSDYRLEIDRAKDDKEQIINAIGGFGKWQLIKCLYIIAIIWMPASFHLLNMVFFRAKTDFACGLPASINHQISLSHWKSLNNESSCNRFDLDWNKTLESYNGSLASVTISNNHKLIQCETYQYDRSFWKRTIIQDFNLVCADENKQKWTQQSTFFGLLCGVFVSGIISDRIGRVKTMMFMLTMTIVCGTLTAFSPTYPLFLAGIWCCGFSTIGFGTVMYCWMMEILSGKEKTIFGCAPHLNYAFWGFCVAVIAYFVPNWHLMELLFSLPLIALYATYWILPESPRWLLTQGRISEAEAVLRKIAKYNGKPLPDTFKLHPHYSENELGSKGRGILGFLELFKNPNMRKKTLITYYLWFATSLIYYGLTLNSNNFGGSLFFIYSFGKGMEFPSITLVIILLLRAGRRITLLSLYLICGLSLLGTMTITQGYFTNDWPIVVLNIIGRASSTGTLALCYVYSAEIFPTVIRNVGIGSSSVWARIGPMIAPYVAAIGATDERLPLMVFGLVAIFAGFLVSFLPETADHKLPDTLEEGEAMGRGDTLWTCKQKRDNDSS